jgi:hypothetical protein
MSLNLEPMTVKVPRRKLYHKLDKMDEMFAEGELK